MEKKASLFIFIFLVFSVVAGAQIFTFKFNGYIHSSGGALAWKPESLRDIVGQSFMGQFSYDDSVVPLIENPDTIYTCYYYDQSVSVDISLGVLSTSHLNYPAEITLKDNYYEPRSGQCHDYFSYSFTTDFPEYGTAEYQIYFFDTTATAFNSFALPESFNLSSFEANIFNIYMGTEDKPIHFYGQITNIELIPEPVTLALLGLGGLLIRRKK